LKLGRAPFSALEAATRIQAWYLMRVVLGAQGGGGAGGAQVGRGGAAAAVPHPHQPFALGRSHHYEHWPAEQRRTSRGTHYAPLSHAATDGRDGAGVLAAGIMRSFLSARVLAAPYTPGFADALAGIVDRLAALLRRRAALRSYGASGAAGAPQRPQAAELGYDGAVPSLWGRGLQGADFDWLDAPVVRGAMSATAIGGFLLPHPFQR
jgi:hypothetical protein